MMGIKRIIGKYPWIIPTLIAAVLIIGAARAHELWGDEAETALFARNILKYGVPKGWDGTNIMGINDAVVLDQNLINHTSPWAQYYMVAASFALFGQSSFTARIPSILLFILSIPIIYYLTEKITAKPRIAFLATLIAALSVQGILFGYQARYYELTNVCGLLFLWASVTILERRIWPKVLFIASGVVFFYANYVSWSAFYAATFISVSLYIWFNNGKGLKRWMRKFCLFTVPIVLFTLPWFLLLHPFKNRGAISVFPLSQALYEFLYLTIDAWRPFNTSGAIPIGFIGLTLVVIIVMLWRKRVTVRSVILFGVLPAVYLIIMTTYATITDVDTTFSSQRYTTVALPLFFLMVAFVCDAVISWRKWIGIGILVIYLVSNLFTFRQPRSYLYLLIQEIVHPYQTPEILVANFLKAHAVKGDTAFVNLDHDHEPLNFLLGDNHAVRFVNRVDFFNTHIFPKNRNVIPRYIYDFRGEPDWLIMYSKRGNDGTFHTMDVRSLWVGVDLMNDYTEHVIPVFFSDLSRPEIELRSFTGIANPAPIDYVYIYEKKK